MSEAGVDTSTTTPCNGRESLQTLRQAPASPASGDAWRSPLEEQMTIRHDLPPVQETSDRGAEFDVAAAIESHQDWKLRLRAVIEGRSQERLDPRIIGRDDQCQLGKWIHTAGARQFGGRRKFADLRARHAYFHVCAGRILTLALSGQKEAAVTEIGPTGEFSRVSRDVTADLQALLPRLDPGA